MWRVADQGGDEAAKVRWDIVPYTRGLGLDIGNDKTFGHFIGVGEGADLSVYAENALDFVFSAHVLQRVEDTEACLRQWWRIIKPGGHLVLYLPHKHYYPNIGDPQSVAHWLLSHAEPTEPVGPAVERLVKERKERGVKSVGALYAGTPFANKDHKHDFLPGDITEIMLRIPGWELVENEERNEGLEYSFFQVYRKRTDDARAVNAYPWKKPGTKKACVCRFGGFGDMIQSSSILPGLKDDGWEVTFMTTPRGQDIIAHDPHIDHWFIQDTDQVPNAELTQYWDYWKKKFDRFINLSESVEGTLLAIPGRANHGWPDELRRKVMGVNYLEFMHAIAQVPGPARQAFYPTEAETQWARNTLPRAITIMWALSGTSVHKAYPHQDAVMAKVLRAIPEVHFILVGDAACEILEAGWQNEPRVMRTSGKWSVRETLTAAAECDMVIGPETGVLNAVGLCHNTKIVLLSHSSPENLTRDWINTDSIVPTVACHPCHRMHYGREFCPEWIQPVAESNLVQDEKVLQQMVSEGHVVDGMFHTGAAICAASIHPDLIFERIQYHYDAWRTHRVIPATG